MPPKKRVVQEEEDANSEDEYVMSGGEDDDAGDDDHLESDADSGTEDSESEEYDPVENEELADADRETDSDTDAEDIDDDAGDEEVSDIGEEGEEGEGADEEDGVIGVESKTCHYKNLNEEFLVLDDDNSNVYSNLEARRVEDSERISGTNMTYYEMVRVIGTRAQQFNLGAPPLIKGTEGMHPAKTAYLELLAGKTPYIVRRLLPGKWYEDYKISELVILHQLNDSYFTPENFDLNSFKEANSGKQTVTDITTSPNSDVLDRVKKPAKKIGKKR